jgi:tetratricopeptide (TPR) repeat protein
MEAEFYFNRGVKKSQDRDLKGAIEDYSMAILLSSGSTRKTVMTERPAGSSESTNIIETSEGNESMYFNRACAYLDLGNYLAAISDLTKFIEYNYTDAEVFFKRAIANYCIENDESAEQDLRTATSLDPKYDKKAFLAIFNG